jgi:hypothetical protein
MFVCSIPSVRALLERWISRDDQWWALDNPIREDARAPRIEPAEDPSSEQVEAPFEERGLAEVSDRLGNLISLFEMFTGGLRVT